MYVFLYSAKCPLTSPQEKEVRGTKFLTEIRAGLTTFFTMAYIVAVNVSKS
jgi:AGZA family xanthine/uracil permease-like MFS transporter